MNKGKSIILLFLFIPLINVFSQDIKESDVPSVVKSMFSTMYPNITNTEWEMENGKYEAEFKENGTETSVLFEQNGTYIQKEVEIPVSSLPSDIIDYAKKTLKVDKINEASLITSSDGTITYEAEIGKEDYIFDAGGKFLRQDSKSGNTEDKDK